MKHAELNLTPFHALIGPNDSGKATLLNALALLRLLAAGGMGGTAYDRRAHQSGKIESAQEAWHVAWGDVAVPEDLVEVWVDDRQLYRTWHPEVPSGACRDPEQRNVRRNVM